MEYEVRSEETSAEMCQIRCQRTPNCEYFSYWPYDNGCHLQDRTAFQVEESDAIAGPVFCPQNTDCFAPDMKYSPVMENSNPTREQNLHACQRRCAKNARCSHFSFEQDGHTCLLHDADAIPVRETQSSAGAGYCPWCSTAGYAYEPIMDGHGATKEVDTEACQRKCGITPGCAYFGFRLMDNVCTLHDADVEKVRILGIISGPPICEREALYDEEKMRRPSINIMFEDEISELMPTHWWSWALFLLGFVCCITSSIFAFTWVRQDHHPTSRSLELSPMGGYEVTNVTAGNSPVAIVTPAGDPEGRYKAMTELVASGRFAAATVQQSPIGTAA